MPPPKPPEGWRWTPEAEAKTVACEAFEEKALGRWLPRPFVVVVVVVSVALLAV